MEKTNTIRLQSLRKLIKEHKLAGYIVPSTDEYLSEYVPNYAKRLEYITGFTGSNGLAVILQKYVLFFTDSRYIKQSNEELDHNLFKIFNQNSLREFNWSKYLNSDIRSDSISTLIGYDPKLFTKQYLKQFQALTLSPLNENLIDKIWFDQPKKPKIYDYPLKYSGEKYQDKIKKCRSALREQSADFLLITDPASVCWLFNIRSSDIQFSPILLAYALIGKEVIYLFTDKDRLDTQRENIIITNDFHKIITEIDELILYDKNQCSSYIEDLIPNKKHLTNPCLLSKARKNKTEISCLKNIHIYDAIAVCETLAFIKNNHGISEFDITCKLKEFRSKFKDYVSDSFATISAYQENGSIIHYSPNKNKCKKIQDSGLLLLDSGGQYLGGTTDITRTIAIGKPTSEQKKYYTKVLKGHIALGASIFPRYVTGANLDILARQYLWNEYKDYNHGTGHGVGAFLNVHEGPQNISLFSNVKLDSGMVLSNEPGYYCSEYGIRIENMMYVKDTQNNFLCFEALSLVPYEKDLIKIDLLSKNEIDYVKNYYKKIKDLILPNLSTDGRKWMEYEINFDL